MRRSILSTLSSLTAELFGVAVAALRFSQVTDRRINRSSCDAATWLHRTPVLVIIVVSRSMRICQCCQISERFICEPKSQRLTLLLTQIKTHSMHFTSTPFSCDLSKSFTPF
jgi:hypothetical protein